jgi:valyl-tRNA synthetase
MTTEGQDIKLAPSRFEMGRNFANKLWNAARFLLMQDRPQMFSVTRPKALQLEDRWILSRLQTMLKEVKQKVDRYRLNEALLAIYDFTWHDFCDWYVELIKPRLYKSDDPAEREATLALALQIFETALRALHPFMPFVTEELWQQIASIKGLDLNLKKPHSVMWQDYPEAEKGYTDREAEKRMKLIQDVVQAIRNIRAEMKVPPQAQADILIKAPQAACDALEAEFNLLATMAKVGKMQKADVKPSASASAVLNDLELYVPLEGLIDLDVEKVRLDKEINRCEGTLRGVAAKLSNPEFINKAPRSIVEREKNKKSDIEITLKRLKHNREDLD